MRIIPFGISGPGAVDQVRVLRQVSLGEGGDADALAAKILQAFDQRKSLPEISRAARAVAEDRADWTKNSTKLMQAYQQALHLK